MEGVQGYLKGKLLIRALEPRDVEPVLAIQRSYPEVAQWTSLDYQRVANGDMAGWVGEEDGQIVGFLIARQIATDIEILNLAVLVGERRRGIGSALLKHALDWGRGFPAEKAFLEVRMSNLIATRFYERHKFEVTARRPRYYMAPVEDALLLAAILTPQ
jgi:[ribosomal protein S18]-alanine N-acetyltransferase